MWASFCCEQTNTNVHCCLTLIDVEPDTRSSGWMSFLCKLELDTVSWVLERVKKNTESRNCDDVRATDCVHTGAACTRLHCIRLEHWINELESAHLLRQTQNLLSLSVLVNNLFTQLAAHCCHHRRVLLDFYHQNVTWNLNWGPKAVSLSNFPPKMFEYSHPRVVDSWLLGEIDIEVHLTIYAPHAHTIRAPQSTDGVG